MGGGGTAIFNPWFPAVRDGCLLCLSFFLLQLYIIPLYLPNSSPFLYFFLSPLLWFFLYNTIVLLLPKLTFLLPNCSFIISIREMENISLVPTFGDFVTICTEGSMQNIMGGCKTTEYNSTDSPLPPLLNVMYCVRVSLRTVKIFFAQH